MIDLAKMSPHAARCCSGTASVEEGRAVLAAWRAAVDAVAAAQAFCNTPPDWTDPAVQRAYGILRDKLAPFAGESP